MKTVNNYDINLNDLYENSTGKLLKSKLFDEKAFVELYEYLIIKAEELKNEYTVSKQIIASIINSVSAIRNASVDIQKSRENIDFANKLEYLLGLIVINEAPSDRVVNTPRII